MKKTMAIRSCIISLLIFITLINKEIATNSNYKMNMRSERMKFEETVSTPAAKGHILFFHHAGTISHLNVLKSLAGGLLEKGHTVTTAFYGKTQLVHENYTEISFPNR